MDWTPPVYPLYIHIYLGLSENSPVFQWIIIILPIQSAISAAEIDRWGAIRTVGPIGSDTSGRKGLAVGWCSRP